MADEKNQTLNPAEESTEEVVSDVARVPDSITALDTKTNEFVQIPIGSMNEAVRSRRFAFHKNQQFNLVDERGRPFSVTGPDRLKPNMMFGASFDTPEMEQVRTDESEFSDRGVEAFSLAALSSATASISDRVLSGTNLYSKDELRNIRKHNETATLMGDVTGFVLPALATAGTSTAAQVGVKGALKTAAKFTPGGAATLLSDRAVKTLGNKIFKDQASKTFTKNLIAKTGLTATASAIEGTVAQSVALLQEEALGESGLNAEYVLSSLGKGALFSGAAGGIFGAVGATIPFAARTVKGGVQLVSGKVKDKLGNFGDITENAISVFGLKPKTIDALESMIPNFKEEFKQYVVNNIDILSSTSNIAGQVKNLTKAAGQKVQSIFSKLDDKLPIKAEKALSRVHIIQKMNQSLTDDIARLSVDRVGQEANINALLKIQGDIADFGAKTDAGKTFFNGSSLQTLRQDLQVLANKNKGANKVVIRESINKTINIIDEKFDEVFGIIDTRAAETFGTSAPKILSELKKAQLDYKIGSGIEKNLEIKAGKDAQKAFLGIKDLFLGGAIGAISGDFGIAATVAAAVKIAQSDLTKKVVIYKQIGDRAAKVNKIIDSAAKGFTKAGSAIKSTGRVIKKATPPTIAFSLSEASFDPISKPPKNENRFSAYERIKSELNSHGENPERLIEMIARKTHNLRAVAPSTSTNLELTGIRIVEFLNSKIPRSPLPPSTLQPNMDKYHPSNIELAKFERYVRGAIQPLSILEDLESNKLNRESVEAVRTIYPALFNQIQNQFMSQISNSEVRLPYQKRLQIGILLDIPSDISLESSNIVALQQQFTQAAEQEQVESAEAAKTQLSVNSRILSNSTVAERQASQAQKLTKR